MITDLEALLVVLVLLQESSVVDNDLGVCNAQVHDLVVYSLRRLDRPEGLFQVDVEGPEFERLEQSYLYR